MPLRPACQSEEPPSPLAGTDQAATVNFFELGNAKGASDAIASFDFGDGESVGGGIYPIEWIDDGTVCLIHLDHKGWAKAHVRQNTAVKVGDPSWPGQIRRYFQGPVIEWSDTPRPANASPNEATPHAGGTK